MRKTTSKKNISPIYIALAVCLSGVLLMPITPFATDIIDWFLFSGAYIFGDGFESGDTSRWSATMSNQVVTLHLKHGDPLAEEILDSVDDLGHCIVPREALVAIASPDLPRGEDVLGFGCRFLLQQDRLVVTFSLIPDLETGDEPKS